MMKDISAAQFNERFLEKVATVSGQAELQEAGRQYTKTELQESAFSRAIVPQEPITTADCQRNVTDDSLYVIRDIEPDAEAVAVDNFGEPDGQIVKGTRYIIPIVNFKTKRYQITVESLRAYQYKITKRIEDKSVPVIEGLEDKFFLRLVGAALNGGAAGTCKVVAGTGTVNATLKAEDFPKIKNTMASGINGSDAKRKEVGCLLMTQELYETAVLLPGVGDDFGKDRVYFGVASDTLYGTKIIKTIKSTLLPIGHVLAFTTPDFLGHNFSLGDPTFEIRSQFGLIEWQTSTSMGVGIGNRLSVALMAIKGAVAPGTATNLEITTDGTVPANVVNYYAGLRV